MEQKFDGKVSHETRNEYIFPNSKMKTQILSRWQFSGGHTLSLRVDVWTLNSEWDWYMYICQMPLLLLYRYCGCCCCCCHKIWTFRKLSISSLIYIYIYFMMIFMSFLGFGGSSICQAIPHIHVFACRFVWQRGNILFNFDLMFLVLSSMSSLSSSSSSFIHYIPCWMCLALLARCMRSFCMCVMCMYARNGIILRHGRSFSSAQVFEQTIFVCVFGSQYHIPYSIFIDQPIRSKRVK